MICIVDYNIGNVASVKKSFAFLGAEAKITHDPLEIAQSSGIVLPGVGAFPFAMEQLNAGNMTALLREQARKKPILGICLGMQLLFDQSEEAGGCAGLSLIQGDVVRLPPQTPKIPHMGWNELHIRGNCPLLKGISEGTYVYFVHSYYVRPAKESVLCATADYGVAVPGVVADGHVFGMQFHPEKSGDAGLRMLKNFWELCAYSERQGSPSC